jgi:transmembrane sensor
MRNGELHIVSARKPVRRAAAAWLARLRADNLSDRERLEFQRWLSCDASHRMAYRRMEALWADLGVYAGTPEIDKALNANGVRQWREVTRIHRGGGRWRARVWATATTLALVVLVGGWFAWHTQQITTNTYVTAVGEQRTLVLGDGSRVTMDTDTRLSIAFSGKMRRLTLERGRAFFSDTKDVNRPFVVTTKVATVRAVGTQFSVYEHNGNVTIALIDGSVIVTSRDNGAAPNTQQTTLEAGQRLSMGPAYQRPVLERLSSNATAWLSGKLVFKDVLLPVAVAELNRYSTDKITIGDAATAGLHVSGVFRSDDPHAFVDALRAAYDVVAKRSASGGMVLHTARATGQSSRQNVTRRRHRTR